MKLTKPGTFLGTAWYVSPEQARADPTVGPATDFWAVGAILYEMIAGVPPFDGAVDVEVLYKVLQIRHRPLAEVVATVPPGLSEVVDRALEKKAGDRYPDAAAFLEALRPFAADRPSAVVHVSTAGVGADPRVAPSAATAVVDHAPAPVLPAPGRSRPTDRGDTGQIAVRATTAHTSRLQRALVLAGIGLVAAVAATVVFRSATRGTQSPPDPGAGPQADTAELLALPDVAEGESQSPSSASDAEPEDARAGREPDSTVPEEGPDAGSEDAEDRPPETKPGVPDGAAADRTTKVDDGGSRDARGRDDGGTVRDATIQEAPAAAAPADDEAGPPPSAADSCPAGMLAGPGGMCIRPTRRDAGR